jgi:hypothetical protein
MFASCHNLGPSVAVISKHNGCHNLRFGACSLKLTADPSLCGASVNVRPRPDAVPQGARNLVFGKLGAIVAFDQQSNAPSRSDVLCPGKGIVERAELLEQELVLLEGGNAFRPTRPTVNAVSHHNLLVLACGQAAAPESAACC